MTHVLFVCTGNAARSVMAGAMVSSLAPELTVTTAGTHVVEGQPISWRTRDALAALGFEAVGHRSHQIGLADTERADVIVCFERFHVGYIRAQFPAAAPRASTMPELVTLPLAGVTPLRQHLAHLGLGDKELAELVEVDDPGGGELDVVQACAQVILDLSSQLVKALRGNSQP